MLMDFLGSQLIVSIVEEFHGGLVDYFLRGILEPLHEENEGIFVLIGKFLLLGIAPFSCGKSGKNRLKRRNQCVV